MRRSDREITDRSEIINVIKKCDVCRIAMNDDDGIPYIVPLNFGMEDDGEKIKFYFHSALEGHKLDLLKKDSRVAFELDCNHQLQYFAEKCMCTMAYESVMGKGTIKMLSDDEKVAALNKLMSQYHPDGNADFNPAALGRTAVYCLEVESITGKRKQPK